MGLKIDWDKAEGKEFEVVPKGTYKCEVSEVKKSETNEGNPYIAWRLKIIEPAEYAGKILFLNTSLLPQSLWKTSEIFNSLGVKTKGQQDYDPDSLLGKMLWCNVIHEQYQGTLRSRVESTRPCADKPKSEPEQAKKEPATQPDLPF